MLSDFPDPFFSKIFLCSGKEPPTNSFVTIDEIDIDCFNTCDCGSTPIENDKNPSDGIVMFFNQNSAVCFGKEIPELST